MATQDNQNILHETAVEDSVIEELEKPGQAGHTAGFLDDALVAHSLNATYDNAEVALNLDNLGLTINEILTILKDNGLMAPS